MVFGIIGYERTSTGFLRAVPFVFLLCALQGRPLFASEVPLRRALDIIETLERPIQRAQWKVRVVTGTLSDVASPASRSLSGEIREAWVIIEMDSGRFRTDLRRVGKWYGGAMPYMAVRESHSFDGKVERELSIQKGSYVVDRAALPSENEAVGREGHIRNGQTEFLDTTGWDSGIAFFPPRFWGKNLGVLLRENEKSVAVREDDQGLWRIRFVWDRQQRFNDQFDVDYDPSKGLVVAAAVTNMPNPDPRPFRRMQVELQKVPENAWVPKTVRIINMFDRPPRFTEITYSDVKINNPVDERIFRVPFPPGTQVYDHTGEQVRRYEVGAGPEGDLEAVRAFIKKEGLDLPPDSGSTRGPWKSVGMLIMIATIVALGVFSVWRFVARKRRGGPASAARVLFVIASYCLTSSAFAAEPPAVDRKEEPILNCGFNVAVFALEYFERYPSAAHVAAALNPTSEGVSLQRIQTVLQAHGLEAVPRQNVQMKELKSALKGRIMAIVPVRLLESPRLDHYLVAVTHHERGPLLVDVLKVTYSLDNPEVVSFFTPCMEPFKRVVLFVRAPPSEQPPLSERIRLNPEKVELGKFSPAEIAGKTRDAFFSIENPTENAIMVSRMSVTCGCLSTEFTGGLLASRRKEKIRFTVSPGAWPIGRDTASIFLRFGDGSEKTVEVFGKRLTVEEGHGLAITPKAFRIDVTGETNTSRIFERKAIITRTRNDARKISVTTTVPWLTAEAKPIDATSAELRLQVAVDGDLLVDKGSVEGVVSVAAEEKRLPIPVKVVLYRQDFFRVSPTTLRLERKVHHRKEALIIPVASRADGLRVLKASTEPPGLNVEFTNQEDGKASILVAASESVAPGHYLVKCLLQSTRQERAVASLIVHVP